MATTTLTTNLKLRISSDMLADAVYNLRRIDNLGSILQVDTNQVANLRSITDIQIQTQDPDIGGSGSGGTLNIGSAGQYIGTTNIYSTNLNINGTALPAIGQLVTLTGTQTLTNKTLTSPILTTPNLGTPSVLVATNATGTAAGLTAGAATLAANSTAVGGITVTGTPSTGQVLTATSSSAANWQTPAGGGGAGTVTSVAMTVPSFLSISGSPITTSGTLAVSLSGTALPVANGGTGQTSYTNGQLLIGNTATGGLSKATLTAGSNITITNGNGTIEIAASGGGGVSSVDVSGGTTGLTTSGGPITGSGTITLAGTLAATNGGTGLTSLGTGIATFLGTPSSANLRAALTDETGTGAAVFATSPALVTPDLGTPSAATLTNATGLPIATGVSGLGTGVATFLATPSSANLRSALTDETGTGAAVFATSPTLVTPDLGTPSALVGTNITGTAAGLTAGTVTTNANLTGAITSSGNATSLGSFSSADLRGALTDETGSGAAVFATSPSLTTPDLGTPSAATLTNATGLPVATGISGLGSNVATFLATPSSANLASAVTDETGSGALVFATSPSLTTPTLGVASATSINKVALTPPASSATLTIADGKTLTASNTLTLTGTDSSSVAFGAGGTVVYTANKLSALSSTSSSELAGVISDETGSGALVFGTSPSFTTSTLHLAQGELRLGDSDSSNYVGFKAPATVGTNKVWTLPDADGSNGQVLSTNGSAVLSWASAGSSTAPTGVSVNYIVPASQSSATGWTASAADITISTDTVSSFLPRQVSNPSSLKIVRNSGSTAYAYYRFALDNVDDTSAAGAVSLMLQCAYMGGASNSSNDWRFQVWTNSAADYSGSYTQQTVVDGIYGAFTATFNNRNWVGYIRDMASMTDPYVELRIKLNASTANTEIHVSNMFAGYVYGPAQAPGQLMGTQTNDAAVTGYVGQQIIASRAFASATAPTSGVSLNVTASPMSLTAGDWEVSGYVGLTFAGAPSVTLATVAGSLVSATLPGTGAQGVPNANELQVTGLSDQASSGNDWGTVLPPFRVSLSATTNFYLVANYTFTGGTSIGVYGHIRARRAR